jgi:predicted ATPase with chaperone activity
MPGEVPLAHNGVLFLDELLACRRYVLEGLHHHREQELVWI